MYRYPRPTIHNIRHHDAPGEVCPYHDHLLRWHPWADSDDDVALLHWHWFVPLVDPGPAAWAMMSNWAPGPGPAFMPIWAIGRNPTGPAPVIRPDAAAGSSTSRPRHLRGGIGLHRRFIGDPRSPIGPRFGFPTWRPPPLRLAHVVIPALELLNPRD